MIYLEFSMHEKMTSQAICMFLNNEYLENETSYWKTKNALFVYFYITFDWDQNRIKNFSSTCPFKKYHE